MMEVAKQWWLQSGCIRIYAAKVGAEVVCGGDIGVFGKLDVVVGG